MVVSGFSMTKSLAGLSELAGIRREGEPSAMIFLFVLDRRLACVDQICLHKGKCSY